MPNISLSNLDLTFGLLYDVIPLAATIYGVALLQGWLYFRKYWRKDPWPILVLVILVIVLDGGQMVLYYDAVYDYLVRHHGDTLYLVTLSKSLIMELYLSAFICVMVQGFYIFRIYRLTRNWFLVVPVAAVSLASFGFLLAYATVLMKFKFITQMLTVRTLSTVAITLTFGSDLLITIIMVSVFHKSKTGMRRTTDLLNQLIIFTFSANIPTTVLTLVCVFTLNFASTTLWYIFFYILIGRFFTNSLLVMLNCRDYIRGGTSQSERTPYNEFHLTQIDNHSNGQGNRAIAIRIDTSTQNNGAGSEETESLGKAPHDRRSNLQDLDVNEIPDHLAKCV